ncbi:MAG: primosomal protein N' [Proteiniphilum sp.]|nr:primosomal protein N' [Proteiniphilum sp.]MDD3956171.1 primosomal protein N' [Proteiniphilum sp.]MDD4452500.1 primosomal protein N' [Proteiniphilum sp.]
MYADVILPLPLHGLFTYAIPLEMQPKIGVGFRVIVPFGSRKHYTAIVAHIHSKRPMNMEIKPIHSLVDSHAIVNEQQLKLWEWIAFYYMSALGDVYKAALPPSMKSRDLHHSFAPQTETFIMINPVLKRETLLQLPGRAKKQQALLAEIILFLSTHDVERISKQTLTGFSSFSTSVLNGLLQKEILLSTRVETSRLGTDVVPTRPAYPLHPNQQKAFTEISECFLEKQTCLLHGVTASGKTEIYIHLITLLLAEGKQTLYLLPEIALTTQLTQRLQAVFGNRLGIYHSGINDNERAEIWLKMLSPQPYEIIIGARSSLFLPFQRLGLVIVDEEHESSYKQQDPAPRYHARDVAVMLAFISGAKTLLGSATPSMESYYNTQTGKYGLVTLGERFNGSLMPEIAIENTRELRRRKKMKTVLSPKTIELIHSALEEREQVILFRNRRGFSPMITCNQCEWTPKCSRCDVSLTYHKSNKQLVCHYCNSTYPVPNQCPSCHQDSLVPMGQGTEQLEEEVTQLFPACRVARMDMDTTRGKERYEQIIEDFQQQKIQILVGTQMLSKGLDFDHVKVVGVVSADSLLNYPDFRSHERGFQMMTQAAGRAGRKKTPGTVVIQSSDPENPIYSYVKTNDYMGFFHAQLKERSLFHYPPFYRLIRVVCKHRDRTKVEKAASDYAELIKRSLQGRVLGPNKPVVERVQLQYIREILLKLENGLSPQKIRDILKNAEEKLRQETDLRQVTLYYDVDPL